MQKTVRVNGVDLHCEETGTGIPLVLCHEYAGDMRAWEPQVRHFGRRYRVITFNYRGYPPSSVPTEDAAYEHDLLISDLVGVLDAFGIARAHIAGLATGGNLALNFAIRHAGRVRGLVVAGAGAGTTNRATWLDGARKFADDVAARGTESIVERIENAPQRVIFKTKDPRGWQEFLQRMHDFSPEGASRMMRIALPGRLPVTALEKELRAMAVPTLVMIGDQDTPAQESSRFIRDHAPHAGLAVIPMCGHTLNSEEPDLFNLLVGNFLAAVDAGRWGNWTAPDLAARL